MAEKLRILMLEDLEEDAGLIERILKKDNLMFVRKRVDTRKDFTEALEGFRPNIILSDHSLPMFNSIEALEICKRKGIKIPFILVTGAVSEEFAVNCIKRGADDYILKSNLSRLPTAIQHTLRQHEYENERIAQGELLRQQNEELVKINKELDSFVYSISHNLRSPLSSVLGLVNVAKLDNVKSAETTDHYFQLIENSVLKLDRTLKEILDYSQNTRTDLEIRDVDIETLMEECFEGLKYMKGYDRIERRMHIKNDTPFYTDAHRLSIILNNLFMNAIRYHDDSKGKSIIKIDVEVNPAFATIVIADNGIGIAEEHLPNIYNMFFRATERSDGAGLGLYIVKEMIARLKGSIRINSICYAGTTVTLSVPNKLLTE